MTDAEEAGKHMTTKPKAHILLVEDDPADVDLTLATLERSKVAVDIDVVGDGQDALDLLYRRGDYADAQRPDLVLLDLNLPVVQGAEVLEIVKSDPDLKAIPVAVLTTSTREEDIVQAYTANANCYIQKPVDLAQLTRVVKSIEDFWFTIVSLPN